MALNSAGWATILAGSAVAFFIGGFLSGIRATRSRALHGAAAALFGIGIYAAFVISTRALSAVISTPDPLSLEPTDPVRLLAIIGTGAVLGALGALVAGSLLSSPGATRLGG